MGVGKLKRFKLWPRTDYNDRIAKLQEAITEDRGADGLSLRDDYVEKFAELSFLARSSKTVRTSEKVLYSRYFWFTYLGLIGFTILLSWLSFKTGPSGLVHNLLVVAVQISMSVVVMLFFIWFIAVVLRSILDGREIAKRHAADINTARFLRDSFDVAALSLAKETLDKRSKIDFAKGVFGSGAFVALGKFEFHRIQLTGYVLDWPDLIVLGLVALIVGLFLGRRSLASRLRDVVSLAIPG